MSLGDFAAIEEDPQHPLHDKAKIVGKAMMAPFAQAVQKQNAELQRAIGSAFGRWAQKALTGATDAVIKSARVSSSDAAGALNRAARASVTASLGEHLAAVTSSGTAVDFSDDELPDATVAEVHDAAQSIVIEGLTRLIDVQQAHLALLEKQATKDDARISRQEEHSTARERILDARERDNARRAMSGVIGGWVAAGVAAISIIVTVMIAIWPKA
jgi:hypothetical protein